MHIATHNEVDDSQLPYVCDICNKRFATSQFLVTHRFRHRAKSYTNDLKLKSESLIEETQNEVNISLIIKNNITYIKYYILYQDLLLIYFYVFDYIYLNIL